MSSKKYELKMNDRVIASLESEEPMEPEEAFTRLLNAILSYIEERSNEEPSAQ